jgi:hypothetical protein
MSEARWPPLRYDDWKGTYATLHLWMQVVGKIALAKAPPVNHSWGVAFDLTTRGFATRPLSHGDRVFTIEFDFVAHLLRVRASHGAERTLPLEPMTVADFYRRVLALLRDMDLPVAIWPVAVELPTGVRLDADVADHDYAPEYAARVWRIFGAVGRVLQDARCQFVGKCSPVNVFWGAFDIAVTRFSGRLAPPREGPAFMREAYSHEVISHGFWPGSGLVQEAAFYAYAVPEPAGLREAPVRPSEAFYHREMGEFILPYEAVRTAADPEGAIRQFVESTYTSAATLAGWDRAVLERPLTAGT